MYVEFMLTDLCTGYYASFSSIASKTPGLCGICSHIQLQKKNGCANPTKLMSLSTQAWPIVAGLPTCKIGCFGKMTQIIKIRHEGRFAEYSWEKKITSLFTETQTIHFFLDVVMWSCAFCNCYSHEGSHHWGEKIQDRKEGKLRIERMSRQTASHKENNVQLFR